MHRHESESEPEVLYEVERIVDYRIRKNAREFKVL